LSENLGITLHHDHGYGYYHINRNFLPHKKSYWFRTKVDKIFSFRQSQGIEIIYEGFHNGNMACNIHNIRERKKEESHEKSTQRCQRLAPVLSPSLMTLFLPLEDSAPLYSTPAFVIKPNDTESQVTKVIKTILKAKRIVVICGEHKFTAAFVQSNPNTQLIGAGISVKAGIPDFRSSEGLFHSLKRDNPKDALSSGKDLFDASVFNVSFG
jgi:hypothetical protein